MGRPSKLTDAHKVEARRRAEGATLKELAESYHVGLATISRLRPAIIEERAKVSPHFSLPHSLSMAMISTDSGKASVMASDVVLFIDANQYLKLYGLVAGKQLLDWLEEQHAHIFVSQQIVDEVLRRKLDCAQTFFLDKFKEIDAIKNPIPDHLLGISDEKTADFRKILERVTEVKTELATLVDGVLSKISRSEDEVSQRLTRLFDKANSPSAEEMQRARDRIERGNPPGKQKDTLGDQITWEQLLTCCRNGVKRLWIITDDGDYRITHGKKVLLNSLLRRDLTVICGVELEVHCHTDLERGITHFRKDVGVPADKLPTEQQSMQIQKEIEALPPFAGTGLFSASISDVVRAGQLGPTGSYAGAIKPTGPVGPTGYYAYTEPTQGAIKPTGPE
jgi:PIN domain